MSKYLIEQETLTDIADAIREKTGGTDEIRAEDFASEISDIETGGGGITPHGIENITANGDYDVTTKEGVHVDVPQGVFPSGTKQISITQNGTKTEDVTNYADAEIVADIPVGATDSEFFKIKKTTITVGENSVINRNTFLQLMIGMLEPNSMIIAFSMAERKSAYLQNEVLLGQFFYYDQTLSAGFGTSYFGAWLERPDHLNAQIDNWSSNNNQCVIVAGTKYDVYYRDYAGSRIADRFPEV